MRRLHVLVPGGIDDPARPSGGNAYDRRVLRGLVAAGWDVHEHMVPGSWPWADAAAQSALIRLVADVTAGAVLLVDGLIASSVPAVVTAAAGRLPVVVLAHMAFSDRLPGHETTDALAREGAALRAASAVVATSGWLRTRLLELYALPPGRVHVAEPGVDVGPVAPGTPHGAELLCVAPVAAHKGHDLLVAGLTAVRDLRWRCVCVGPLDRDPDFVARLRDRVQAAGIAGRVDFAGPRTPAELDEYYAAADVLVHPSMGESYGMVVVEA